MLRRSRFQKPELSLSIHQEAQEAYRISADQGGTLCKMN